MAPDFFLQRVLASEERSRNYVRGSMCALKGKRQARARPAPFVPACPPNSANKVLKTDGLYRMYPATWSEMGADDGSPACSHPPAVDPGP